MAGARPGGAFPTTESPPPFASPGKEPACPRLPIVSVGWRDQNTKDAHRQLWKRGQAGSRRIKRPALLTGITAHHLHVLQVIMYGPPPPSLVPILARPSVPPPAAKYRLPALPAHAAKSDTLFFVPRSPASRRAALESTAWARGRSSSCLDLVPGPLPRPSCLGCLGSVDPAAASQMRVARAIVIGSASIVRVIPVQSIALYDDSARMGLRVSFESLRTPGLTDGRRCTRHPEIMLPAA